MVLEIPGIYIPSPRLARGLDQLPGEGNSDALLPQVTPASIKVILMTSFITIKS